MQNNRGFCVDAGHALPDQAGVMLRTVPSPCPRYEMRRGRRDMDACWLLEMFAEIAKVFWCDRHPRLRKSRPSVPQVPPRWKSEDAM